MMGIKFPYRGEATVAVSVVIAMMAVSLTFVGVSTYRITDCFSRAIAYRFIMTNRKTTIEDNEFARPLARYRFHEMCGLTQFTNEDGTIFAEIAQDREWWAIRKAKEDALILGTFPPTWRDELRVFADVWMSDFGDAAYILRAWLTGPSPQPRVLGWPKSKPSAWDEPLP
jgi:hypothetical protein